MKLDPAAGSQRSPPASAPDAAARDAVLRQILDLHHAAASALGTALIDAELLAHGACASEQELRDVAAELARSLVRLKGMLAQATQLARRAEAGG